MYDSQVGLAHNIVAIVPWLNQVICLNQIIKLKSE